MVEMTSTFVGRQRERELKTLRNSMQNALKGKGSIVLVAGEVGIGKSELINEFLRRIASITDEEIRFAQTACCNVVGDTDSFRPFHDLFDGVFIDKDKKQVRRKLVNIISDIAPDIANLVPVVGGQISAGISISRKLIHRWGIGHDKEHLLERKEISQERFCSESTKALQGASSVYPLVLVIDDLQWIDDSSANLLFSLPEKIKDDRILILGAYHPEELAPRAGQPHPLKEILSVMVPYENVSTIELGFLQLKDVSTYISRIYPNNSFPLDFIDFVWKRTEGNSLFMVELIKSLEEDQIIAKENTKWSLTKEIRDIEANTPKKVEAVIEHRISNIRDKIDRQIHECASVEGEKFTSDVLSELLSMDKINLSRKLRIVGEMYNLVRESIETSMEIGSYEFIHSLIHESFYNHLGREERILLHQKIGEILEAKYKGDNRVKEFASTLAPHFEEGLILDKALKYYRTAADEAEKTNSFAEASRLYEKVNKIMVESRIGAPKERVEILIKMGAIYQILGRGEEARNALKESLDLNAKIGDDLIEASNLTNLGVTYFLLGELDRSINVLEKAKKTYKHHEEDLSNETLLTYGICLNWLGINYRNNSEFDKAMNFHHKALNIAKDVKNPRLEAHVNANIGAIYLWKKEFSHVINPWKQSLKISKEINDHPWEAHYTIDVGYMYFLERNYDEALKKLEKSTDIAKEYCFEDNLARGLMNQGSVWFAKGDPEKAMKLYEEALEIAKMQKVARLIWRLQHNIGNIYRKKEEYEKAYEWYLSSIKSLKKMISTLKSEDEKKGFLEHRLDPFRSMILLTWEREEEESRKSAKTFGYDILIDFLDDRKQGVDLNEKEAENWNFFDGYYVVTE